jgi:hypothetical protein
MIERFSASPSTKPHANTPPSFATVTREFHFHSCNHRSCPQCGKDATAEGVERELAKRVAAPYFMVTFTLPAELRKLFFTPQAKESYQLYFAAASSALSDTLANPKIPRSLRLHIATSRICSFDDGSKSPSPAVSHAAIASRKFDSSSDFVSPCVTQPGNAGISAQ